jgi:crotonobetainyl-CoA:carnitine CoA-transferase CaiB-like acyl-CoA transferase
VPEVIEQPQAAARALVIDAGCDGVKTAGIPIKLSLTPGHVRRSAPKIGEDNAAYLEPVAVGEGG